MQQGARAKPPRRPIGEIRAADERSETPQIERDPVDRSWIGREDRDSHGAAVGRPARVSYRAT
jgi:hypothetical protein